MSAASGPAQMDLSRIATLAHRAARQPETSPPVLGCVPPSLRPRLPPLLLALLPPPRSRTPGADGECSASTAFSFHTSEFPRRPNTPRNTPILAGGRRGAVPTFREAAERTLAERRANWRGDGHPRAWERTFEPCVFPALGLMRVDALHGAALFLVGRPVIARGRPSLRND